MRIIAGHNRGKKLITLPGTRTRPTSDRVREALFNILRSTVPGARVLDLFAGSGALGLEALSRGAQKATFIDNHPQAVGVIRRNIVACGRIDQSRVLRWDISKDLLCLKQHPGRYDLVFMDPPYQSRLIPPAMGHLDEVRALEKGARVVAEHDGHEPTDPPPAVFRLSDRRRYGKTHISIWEYQPSEET